MQPNTQPFLPWLGFTLVPYLFKLLWHKVLIFLFGIYINFRLRDTNFSMPWRSLITHDWSKFSPAEFFPYARYFYGANRGDARATGFVAAFAHHVKYQAHHAEHFWTEFAYPSTPDVRCAMSATARRMPDELVVEMVVDWHAAELSYNSSIPRAGKPWKWVSMVSNNTGLHPVSAVVLHALLVFLGFADDAGGVAEFSTKVSKVVPGDWATPENQQTLRNLHDLLKQLDAAVADQYLAVLPR